VALDNNSSSSGSSSSSDTVPSQAALKTALARLGLDGSSAAAERAAFVATGAGEESVFERLAALLEVLQHEPYAREWAALDAASAKSLAKSVVAYLKGRAASGDVRSVVAQVVTGLRSRVRACGDGSVLGQLVVAELGWPRFWAHCVAGLQEATVMRARPSPREAGSRARDGGVGSGGGADDGGGEGFDIHDPSALAFLALVEVVALGFTDIASEPRQAPPPELTAALLDSLSDSTDEVYPQVCKRLVDVSAMLGVKRFHDHVIDSLAVSQEVRVGCVELRQRQQQTLRATAVLVGDGRV
jgi:hypothetical protein